MAKILYTFSLDQGLTDMIKRRFGNDVELMQVEKLEDAGESIKEFDVFLTNQMQVNKEDLDRMASLKWIQCVFSGVNHFPLEYLKSRNIILTNARGVHRIQMSEYTIGLILMIARRSAHYLKAQMQKKWEPVTIDELYGKTVGFIGTGAIARETARKLKPFGVRIIGVKNKVEKVDHFDEIYGRDRLGELLEQSDYVITLVPLTRDTYKMIGEEQFRQMKKTAWFINIARGDIVDEKALIKALQEGWIAGAGLDVFEEEPLPGNSPLWEMENVIITPHIAGPTPCYMNRLMEIFIKNLEAYIQGKTKEMVNVIDYNKGY